MSAIDVSEIAAELPNLSNLGDGPQKLIGVSVAFLAVAWISVVLRVWVRAVHLRAFGWDDWFILVAIISFTIQCIYLIIIGTIELRPQDLDSIAATASILAKVLGFTGAYVLSTIFLKISLAFFFVRILVQPWQKMLILTVSGIYTLYGFIYFGLAIFGCGNPADYLVNTIEGKCIPVVRVIIPCSYAQSALNAFTDWVFVIVPISAIWNLHLARPAKAWAGVLLALGALGSVASLIRLGSVKGLVPGRDFLETSTAAAVWSIIEPGLGITAVSLATLRPMFRSCLGRGGSKEGRSAAPQENKQATQGPGSDRLRHGGYENYDSGLDGEPEDVIGLEAEGRAGDGVPMEAVPGDASKIFVHRTTEIERV